MKEINFKRIKKTDLNLAVLGSARHLVIKPAQFRALAAHLVIEGDLLPVGQRGAHDLHVLHALQTSFVQN